jgi:hypothetical protein
MPAAVFLLKPPVPVGDEPTGSGHPDSERRNRSRLSSLRSGMPALLRITMRFQEITFCGLFREEFGVNPFGALVGNWSRGLLLVSQPHPTMSLGGVDDIAGAIALQVQTVEVLDRTLLAVERRALVHVVGVFPMGVY